MGYEEALRRIEEAKETGATELNLNRQGLTELPPELFELKNLTELDLAHNKFIHLPPEIVQLTNLTTLVLFGNQLTSLPSKIVHLTNFTILDLGGNSLTSLPPEIAQLTNLAELYLTGNQLTELPKEIAQLSELEVLDLDYNKLDCLCLEVCQLCKLELLSLYSNRLTILPPQISQLTNLASLNLINNQLATLPIELFSLKNLTELDLGGNSLTSLPPEIVQLSNLQELDIHHNEISSLPLELFQLKQLTTLNLWYTQLTNLPPEIIQLTNLQELYLNDNPLSTPPYELAVQGIEAIREYFASAEEGTRSVSEVKVILVGEGASGKTSLTRCLRDERFNEREETTHGIRIKNWQLVTDDQELRCNLWDFGGQEIMHATHQFFLSHRSLYVLVLDGRQDNKAEYWLRYIESFGGGSPVLVVLNKYDTNPSFDLDRPFLQEKYPFIAGFWRTSCRTGNGIRAFREALLKKIQNVPLTRNEWPLSWFRAKAKLEQVEEPRISYEAFVEVCRDAGVGGEISQEVLGEFLHDLGIVIHFNDFGLDDNHVLDPKWVTGAVYKIINAESVAASNGLLRLDALKKILRPHKDDPYIYRRADHRYIIELMKKFELCYELPSEEVLIPQLLAVPQPTFDFPYKGALCFVLHYTDFLPPSVMPRFIVKRHQEIKDRLRWRTGVVLTHPQLQAVAVVRADNEARRIRIAVTGRERKIYLALLWLSLREINTGFEGLKVSERVPLPDDPKCSVPYANLLKYREQGLDEFIPECADKKYSAVALLNSIHPDSQSDGENMLALAKDDKEKGRLGKFGKGLNRYFDVELKAFGVKFDYKTFFDDILNKKKR